MATTKQIAANRKNAALSTGPVTKSGKATVASNAVRHGLLSREAILKGEDEASLSDFSARMWTELQPSGEVETLLVDRIIASAWRLKRLIRVEVGLFHREMDDMFGERGDVGLAFIRDGNGADAFSKLSRYESAIERSMYRALHELQRLQAERAGQNVPLPVVVEVCGEVVDERG
ncbi:MAG: hypothetical protein HYX78_03180 [Armatimonadetes bacterium]|nr:hypothetical protein [Armatimonadota bacterium]